MFDAVGLQMIRLPDPLYGGGADALMAGHAAHTPVGCVLRFCAPRGLDDRGLFLRGEGAGAAGSGLVFQDAEQSVLHKSPTPEQHSRQAGRQLSGQLVIRRPLRRTHHDSTAEHNGLRGAGITSDPPQFGTLRQGEGKSGSSRKWHDGYSMPQPRLLVKTFMIHNTRMLDRACQEFVLQASAAILARVTRAQRTASALCGRSWSVHKLAEWLVPHP